MLRSRPSEDRSTTMDSFPSAPTEDRPQKRSRPVVLIVLVCAALMALFLTPTSKYIRPGAEDERLDDGLPVASNATIGSSGRMSDVRLLDIEVDTIETDEDEGISPMPTRAPVWLRTEREIWDSVYRVGKTSSWDEHFEALNDDNLAPMTKWTQKWIREWQNPPLEECGQRKFLLFSDAGTDDAGHGLGSTVHITTCMLRKALELGRILAWDTHTLGQVFIEPGCEVDGQRNLDCIFEPLTHCPRSSMREHNTISLGFKDSVGRSGKCGAPPSAFAREVDRHLPFKMMQQAKKYLWRAQSSAYVMRLNAASLAELYDMRMDASRHTGFSRSSGNAKTNVLDMPYPLPKGAISMHVRHGDKWKEMKLVPFEKYVEAAEQLASLNPLGYARMAYLSSEDPQVFEDARKISFLDPTNTSPQKEWTWYSSSIDRINGGPAAQLEAFGNRTETTLSWIMELLIAMECDAFVGTRGSSWNRLIDELRCTWLPKGKHPYVEVGTKDSWERYNW